MKDVFEKLSKLNINDKTDKKGKFTYLSWAWAWEIFMQSYPSATYEIIKNVDNLPYFQSDAGGMVYTKVTAGEITHEMWLPIMDIQNKAKKTFDMMDVNKAVMRCLVKNLAMFGLGLYIYAGEDLPEPTDEVIEDNGYMFDELEKLIIGTKDADKTTQWICKTYDVIETALLNTQQLKHIINLLQQKAKQNENPKS